MGKILIIGYGNPLRGDDGLGPVAVKRLRVLVQDDEVKFLDRHQLGVELAEDLSRADFAVFIDAHVGNVAGALKEEAVIPDNTVPGSFSHHLRPGVLLSLVQALYNKHPEAVVFSICARAFEHGEGLSPAVEAAMPMLVDHVLASIAAFRSRK